MIDLTDNLNLTPPASARTPGIYKNSRSPYSTSRYGHGECRVGSLVVTSSPQLGSLTVAFPRPFLFSFKPIQFNQIKINRIFFFFLFSLSSILLPGPQFYAAVELKRNPSLKGKTFGVGKGLLVTASYEARAFGVSSGMAEFVARALCPEIILIGNDMSSYCDASDEVMKIFRSWDPNLSQASLDEAYLDVTPACERLGITVDECVTMVRIISAQREELVV